MFWALLVLITLTNGSTCTPERIWSCLLDYVDVNNDTQIDIYEFNNYILAKPCQEEPPLICGDTIMEYCDKDGNGFITNSTKDMSETNGCLRIESLKNEICRHCDLCDLHYERKILSFE